jgi:hypothetical protein
MISDPIYFSDQSLTHSHKLINSLTRNCQIVQLYFSVSTQYHINVIKKDMGITMMQFINNTLMPILRHNCTDPLKIIQNAKVQVSAK